MVEVDKPNRNALPGKFVIAAMLVMGVAAATFAWQSRKNGQRQALAFWGPQAALLIRDAAEIELLELADATEDAKQSGEQSGDLLKIAGGPDLRIVVRRSLVGTPGMLNARHALLRDSSCAWNNTASEQPNAPPSWRYALRFSDAESEIIITLDLDHSRLGAFNPPREAAIDPISQALRNVISRNRENVVEPDL